MHGPPKYYKLRDQNKSIANTIRGLKEILPFLSKMDNLVRELKELEISVEALEDETFWEKCTESIRVAWVPEKLVGLDRPCEERDFREYRAVVNKYLNNVLALLRLLRQNWDNGKAVIDHNRVIVKSFTISVLLLIGEQSEKRIWNNAESVILAREISSDLCLLLECQNLSQTLSGPDNKFHLALLTLRPKLLRETWKKFPAAVTCYKWLLEQVCEPFLSAYIGELLPTALIIYDDYVPENRIVGLECIYMILQHSRMKRELMENGYADVIYDALERLTHQRDVRYILPLYACITSLLTTMEFCTNSINSFEWTKRDDVIATLLENMECEQNLELRRAYMLSLPQLLTNVGCAKWCEYLTRVLTEYCGNHTDLKTLKATLQAAETVLSMFQLRIPAHCDSLYTAFLKLHIDLTETPVFDKEINQTLESCIYLLYKLTPSVGSAIMRDDRVRSIIKNSVHFASFGDTKYCN